MATSHYKPQVILRERFCDTYVKEGILGGLINWYRKSDSTKIGQDIIVEMEEPFDRLVVNGQTTDLKF